jgi:hypothetical protein
MAEQPKSGVGSALSGALTGAVSLTANAVATTVKIADRAVTAVGAVGTAGADAVGVLGEGTIKAAQTIGTAALDATSAASTATLSTATKVTGTALDVTTKAVDASGKIANAATGAAATITSGALDATTKLSTAATGTVANIGVGALSAAETIATTASKATTDVASTGLKTAASTTVTTTEQVGKALTAGINLAGNTTTTILVGLDNIRGILAKKAANVAAVSNQAADAKSRAISAGESTVIKTELLKAFDELEKLTSATLTTLDGVQKTSLIGKINIYKKISCMAIKRWAGLCKSGEIGADMTTANKIQSSFKTATSTSYGTAKTSVATGVPYDKIVSDYEQAIASAVTTFVEQYKALHDKYDRLIETALAAKKGGRRTRRSGRRTTGHKRVHRTSRVLLKHLAKRR